MAVITLAARKGGVGRTFLAANLSVVAAQRAATKRGQNSPVYHDAALVDLDPKQCLTDWRRRREAWYPAILNCVSANLHDVMRSARCSYGTVLIDTPAEYGPATTPALIAADLVVIPVGPGDLEFEAAMKTVELAKALNLRYSLLPNDGVRGTGPLDQTSHWIRQYNLPVLPTIHHRVDAVLKAGKSVSEQAPDSKAAQEIAAVWDAIVRATSTAARNAA